MLEDADKGELLDALNAVEAGSVPPGGRKSSLGQAAETFQSASRRVEEAARRSRNQERSTVSG